jgi:hypothetical protein
MNQSLQEMQTFLESWTDSDERNKAAFVRLKAHLEAKAGVRLEFIPRPGVTYSLRAARQQQEAGALFVMVDVIEDDPRWLSVCFYAAMISDPEEQGDFVPQGLLGEDAMCFDIDQYDEALLSYLESRMDEAAQNAVTH